MRAHDAEVSERERGYAASVTPSLRFDDAQGVDSSSPVPVVRNFGAGDSVPPTNDRKRGVDRAFVSGLYRRPVGRSTVEEALRRNACPGRDYSTSSASRNSVQGPSTCGYSSITPKSTSTPSPGPSGTSK